MISTENFYVITVISNPIRYRSRYQLYQKFAQMCEAGKVKLITVELAFGDRDFNVTEKDNPYHVQVRSVEEYFHKESLMNIGLNYIMQFDPKAKKVAWIDADVFPAMPPEQWFYEIAQALEHYEVVQCWEWAQDLDYRFNPIGKQQISFMAAYVKSGYSMPTPSGFFEVIDYTRHGHPGYAWAANIDALNKVGGFYDFGILGSSDRNMATALIGCYQYSIPDDCTPGYKRSLEVWQERALRWLKKDVGYVHGRIDHYWHGSKKNRGYVDRWKILINNQYDPYTDLKKDAQGLYQLETWDDRQIMLRDQIRTYFRQRNEDALG
jgi:hypothetical protein